MLRKPSSWQRLIGICLVVAFVLLASLPAKPSAAQSLGCSLTACYICRASWWGLGDDYCDELLDNEWGHLCCKQYPNPDGGTWCRAYDQECYGITIRDIM